VKVFIAEDESLIAEGLRFQLQTVGYEVVGMVNDGNAVLTGVQATQPDVVLMDINIPGIGGLEAARLLTEYCPVAVVILTGYNDSELVREAADIGVEAYLVKPVDENDLKPALELAYANFSRKRQLKEEATKTRNALAERKLIERAKGLLMDLKQLSEPEAMAFLQKKSRDSRQKISQVAREIIEAIKRLEE